jgi:uncharacterized lipoprotein YmbA
MKIVAPLLLPMLLVGCSSTTIETQYYLLRQQQIFESRELKPSPDFSLGRVDIAAYIDRPGLMLEVGNGQVRPAQYHQWAEPLHSSVRVFLQREISLQLGTDLFPTADSPASTSIEIRVDQLHGTSDGEALLLAYWWTTQDGEIQSIFQYTQTETLTEDGYAALANAEEVLLSGFAKSIANTLQAIP